MPVSKKQKAYAKKYHDKFDIIRVRVPKGKYDEYKAKLPSNKSMNCFVLEAIEEKIKRYEEAQSET